MKLVKSILTTILVVGLWTTFGLHKTYAEAKKQKITEPVKVEAGDSLEVIAKKYGSTTEMWKKANFLEDHYLIIGQTLNIVFPYRVLEGDQIDYLAKKYNTTVFAIKNLNHLEIEELQPGMVLSIPVNSNKMSKERSLLAEKNSKQANKQQQSKVKKNAESKQKRVNKTKDKKAAKTTTAISKNSLTMRATAYNIEGNEKWGNLTASGTTVRHGVVAVDPKVIPLGTKLYISGYNSPLLPKGGFVAIAEDTGGAIKGNRIDIFIDAPREKVSDFGIQNVKVTILK